MNTNVLKLARNFAMDSVFSDRPYREDDWDVMCSRYDHNKTSIDGFMPSEEYQGYTNDYVIEAVTSHFSDYITFAESVIKEMKK